MSTDPYASGPMEKFWLSRTRCPIARYSRPALRSHHITSLLRGDKIGPRNTQNRSGLRRNVLIYLGKLERAKGFEPSTPTLARLCSTPELRPL